MLKHTILFFLAFLLSAKIYSQEPQILEKLPVPDFIDTLFIDHDINNWSLRAFANFKDHRFQIGNEQTEVVYTPSNPGGIGLGFATRKLIIDFGLNLQLRDRETTERFDFRASLIHNQHNLSYFLQSYHGFNLQNELSAGNGYFRHDISSFTSGLNYMYIFNASEYSFSAMKSGLSKQKKTALSFGLGGFTFYNNMKADSSMVPNELYPLFNDEAMITRYSGVGGGIHGGFSIIIPFFERMFASASLTPGIGLSYKDVSTETGSYFPSNKILAHSMIEAIIGYNGIKYYFNLSMNLGLYKSYLDFGNWVGYRTSQAKFAVGFKLGSN